MIIYQINEISVWLDQLEDEGQDVLSMRLLCSYNYCVPLFEFFAARDYDLCGCGGYFSNFIEYQYISNGYYGVGDGTGTLEEESGYTTTYLSLQELIQEGIGDATGYSE